MTTGQDGVTAIADLSVGCSKRHFGVRTLRYFFVDLVTGRFQREGFVRQGAFMAGTELGVARVIRGRERARNATGAQSSGL